MCHEFSHFSQWSLSLRKKANFVTMIDNILCFNKSENKNNKINFKRMHTFFGALEYLRDLLLVTIL